MLDIIKPRIRGKCDLVIILSSRELFVRTRADHSGDLLELKHRSPLFCARFDVVIVFLWICRMRRCRCGKRPWRRRGSGAQKHIGPRGQKNICFNDNNHLFAAVSLMSLIILNLLTAAISLNIAEIDKY
jgi:hypothetical protein